MKYDEKYKMKGILTAEPMPGLVFSAEHSGSCWHCGDETNWFDINFQAPICSTECHEELWNEYSMATIRGPVWSALDALYEEMGSPPILDFSLLLREWVTAQLEEDEEPVEF